METLGELSNKPENLDIVSPDTDKLSDRELYMTKEGKKLKNQMLNFCKKRRTDNEL
jgi:hypothetical protein